jgi:hypothetical protein
MAIAVARYPESVSASLEQRRALLVKGGYAFAKII